MLLARRSSKLAFHGGAWVFPGGRIDPEDYARRARRRSTAAARRAAAREAKEEAGVDVDPDALVHLSNWTTPEISPKRFATWFFVGPVAGGDAVADGTETDALQWFRSRRSARGARRAVRSSSRRRSTSRCSTCATYATVADAMAGDRGRASRSTTRPASTSSKVAARSACTAKTSRTTTSRSLDADGPRHRLYLGDAGWEYIRD